jgi:hypothetical protein
MAGFIELAVDRLGHMPERGVGPDQLGGFLGQRRSFSIRPAAKPGLN